MARRGRAWHGKAWLGMARQGEEKERIGFLQMAKQIVYGVDGQITGYTPLLMHKVTIGGLSPTPNTPETDYSREWMSTCYLGADGKSLVCPSANLESMLVAVAVGKKIRKVPVMKLVSQLDFSEMDIPISLDGKAITVEAVEKNGWIDVRGVVVQKARVARARVRIPSGWTVNFHIDSRTGLLSADYLKALLEEAGELVGLMDYRPQKKGKFGQFEVTGFDVS